jgi:hypothetical protein
MDLTITLHSSETPEALTKQVPAPDVRESALDAYIQSLAERVSISDGEIVVRN